MTHGRGDSGSQALTKTACSPDTSQPPQAALTAVRRLRLVGSLVRACSGTPGSPGAAGTAR